MSSDEPTVEEAAGASTGEVEAGATYGRYQLRSCLGVGGMGMVFEAYDPGLDRTIAVKVLRPGLGGGKDATRRLQREGQVMARLSHPNVVHVYDVGFAQGSVFVAMEHVHGRTLQAWLDDDHTPEEILDALVQAARGLAAAHDAGFVHRDFKPSNALVRDDGRVLVTDFGLARTVGTVTMPDDAALGGGAVDATLTQADAVVGTPAYMAPEQFLGGAIDARADQFSFCVVLWKALHRAAPFPGATWPELKQAVTAGALARPPATSRCPAHLRDVMVRGLQTDPERRFRSMHELIAAISPRRRRGPWIAAAAALLVTGVAIAWAIEARRPAAGDPCATSDDRFAGVWDGPTREAVHAAFAASDAPYREQAFAEVAQRLDARRLAWTTMRRDSCVATRVRRDQSDAAFDLRAACLDRRLADLAAFVGELRQADRTALAIVTAAQRAAAAGDVTSCADVAALSRRAPLPGDPAARVEVEAIEAEVRQQRARAEAGNAPEVATTVDALVARARAAGYPPVLADALSLAAFAYEKTNRAVDGERMLEDAVLAAEAGGDDALRYELEIRLLVNVGYSQERDADGQRHAERAAALLQRLGADPRRDALLARSLGVHHWTFGRYDLALREGERAVALLEPIDPDGADIARALHNLAIVYDDLNQQARGLPYEERAVAIGERVFGPGHPTYGSFLNTLANLLQKLDRLDEVEAMRRANLALVLRTVGPDSVEVGGARMNLGNTLKNLGRLDEAIVELRLAVAQYEKTVGLDHSWTATALDNLGGALSDTGDPALRDEAERTMRRAVAALGAQLGPDAPPTAIATRHLAEHLLEQGRAADAAALYAEAVRAIEASQGKDSRLLTRHLIGLAEAQVALGDRAAARAALDRALAVLGGDPADDELREQARAARAKL